LAQENADHYGLADIYRGCDHCRAGPPKAVDPARYLLMRAVFFEEFGGPVSILELPDPEPPPDGVVIRVEATGLCLSDWHGWMGHDPDISLPHVPGHELAGTIVVVGGAVTRWKEGDRVTLPFVCGCGACPQCESGNHQVCDRQFQPGFTHWGSFAEFVAIGYADVNLVRLPESINSVTAASLGCRFATAFRAVVDQGRIAKGQWLAVHGCGGVGLSAVMVGAALGAKVIAIDINEEALALAGAVGAQSMLNPAANPDVISQVRDITGGGAHVSIDALGSPVTCFNSVACLRKRGRHVQVGLMPPAQGEAVIPMDRVVANELELVGSHGMQAHRYPQMLELIEKGLLQPQRLLGNTISLDEVPAQLVKMNAFDRTGVTVVDRF
jgi:alcohol dehydrogenase